MRTTAFDVQLASWVLQREALSKIRFSVFVVEQGVPIELELDERDGDPSAVVHVVAISAGGDAIGTARMLLEPEAVRIGADGRHACLAGSRSRYANA